MSGPDQRLLALSVLASHLSLWHCHLIVSLTFSVSVLAFHCLFGINCQYWRLFVSLALSVLASHCLFAIVSVGISPSLTAQRRVD